ncbi:MAG: hypothetical protein HDR01_11195 [Lachnospiraceae bacterium]|nr:hypothetical protein [Lachnospiraceae bacterium]
MKQLTGVFSTKKKNGELYYRSSITYHKKHISLGSFFTESEAHRAYLEADRILKNPQLSIDRYQPSSLSLEKAVVLFNFRDNDMYIGTPIYIRNRFFQYYLSKELVLTFDIDDLFYYSSHKIMKRGGHFFVADYGMQVNILNRYGIKNFGVKNRDYIFKNGDDTDFRYENIQIINPFHGVFQIKKNEKTFYKVKIHINGDYIVGIYSDEITAAIAYNKAADIVKQKGFQKNFPVNFIENLLPSQYAEIYSKAEISQKILQLTQ